MKKTSLPDFYKIISPELFEAESKRMGKKEKTNPPPAETIPTVKE